MKEHKKLYKSGKMWVVATVLTTALAVTVGTTNASADTTGNNSAATETIVQTSPNSPSASQVAQLTDQSTPNINYNTEYQKTAPAIVSDSSNESSATHTDQNGVESTVALSATNKNTNQTTSATGKSSMAATILNTKTASNVQFQINITNNTGHDQELKGGDYWYQLPAWFGTRAQLVVDDSAAHDGTIVFGGNYTSKNIQVAGFDLANSKTSSTGYSQSAAAAAQHPELIGGFQVSGVIKNGETITIIVPLRIVDQAVKTSAQPYGMIPGAAEMIGIWYGPALAVRQAQMITDLANQNGKKYFLVDVANSSLQNGYYSIPQSVIDALNRDGLYPTFQTNDVIVNNYDFNNNQHQDFASYEAYVNYTNAVERLQSVLNKYGYRLVDMRTITGFNTYAYDLKPATKFYDAEGNELQLGTGDLANFYLAVEEVVTQKGSLVITKGTNMDIADLFTVTNGEEMQISGDVDQNKVGVYPVMVSTADGTVSREFNVVVVAPQTVNVQQTADGTYTAPNATDFLTPESVAALGDGYTVAFATTPDFSQAGRVPVKLIITDADGFTHTVMAAANVTKAIIDPDNPAHHDDNKDNNKDNRKDTDKNNQANQDNGSGAGIMTPADSHSNGEAAASGRQVNNIAAVKATNNVSGQKTANELPQTGAAAGTQLAAWGLLGLAFTSLLGLRKRD